VDYTVVVDSDGQTLTQDTAGGVVIRCTDAAGNSFWRPVAEVRGGPEEAQADLGIELGPVAVAPQAAEAVADTPARQPATPEAAEAETDAQARSRRAEVRTQIAAANEYRRQATWAREEAARTAEEEEAAEEGEQAEEEARVPLATSGLPPPAPGPGVQFGSGVRRYCFFLFGRYAGISAGKRALSGCRFCAGWPSGLAISGSWVGRTERGRGGSYGRGSTRRQAYSREEVWRHEVVSASSVGGPCGDPLQCRQVAPIRTGRRAL